MDTKHTPGLPRNRLEGLMSEAADKMNELYADRDRLKAENDRLREALSMLLVDYGDARFAFTGHETDTPRMRQARAAIAKARGE